MKRYAPPQAYLWDPWFVQQGELWTMFHLQSCRNGRPDDRHHNSPGIGTAVSANLAAWESRGIVLTPGQEGSWDDFALWSGSYFRRDNSTEPHCLFYTGRARSNFYMQQIGLATSTDMETWRKHPVPVLEASEPYMVPDAWNELGAFPAWRDPFVLNDPVSGEVYAAIAAHTTIGTKNKGCIGLAKARTNDLTEWDLMPPLLAPARYKEMGAPQVVFEGGHVYLFFRANSEWWLTRSGDSCRGLYCYVADSLFGEYRPANETGRVFDSMSVLGLRLVQKHQDGYYAVGWSYDPESDFVGLSQREFFIRLQGYKVNATPVPPR